MKILVCISHVPDTTSKIRFTDDNKTFDSKDIQYIISPYDELGLTRALEIKEQLGAATITVANVGLKETEVTIRKALAIGADDAIRVDAAPTDAFFVASQLAEIANQGEYDYIITGKESIDYNGGQVGEMLAEMLGLDSISSVSHFEYDGNEGTFHREIDGGKETIKCEKPFVVTAQKGFALEPRIPSMRGIMQARRKKLNVVAAVDSNLPTVVVKHDLPEAKSACKMIPADAPEQLAQLLHDEAKVI
jgi:electron transfer flavoprotein beta subunit